MQLRRWAQVSCESDGTAMIKEISGRRRERGDLQRRVECRALERMAFRNFEFQALDSQQHLKFTKLSAL
jgi:hypothetical protein